jgi:2-keto-4-pentenoate hydratase/2-oxohepta-3-ene-1,7-dioic acid hydratase in catechol pathway
LKFASFRVAGKECFGPVIGSDTIIDLCAIEAELRRFGTPPRTMLDLIEAGAPAVKILSGLMGSLSRGALQAGRYRFEEIEWRPPILRPSKICCIALNNSANSDRIMSGPKHPAMFIKPASALIGHQGHIVCKPEYGRTHPEPELAVVIGRLTKDVSVAQAYDHVFGYTIHNDITSPKMRGEDTFHYRAIHPSPTEIDGIEYIDTWVSYPGRYKCADTFACMGPWVVTADEVPDPHALTVSCLHQGRTVTTDNTANLLYKIPEVICFISNYLTLLPGDIISMGTALAKASSGSGAIQNVDLNKLGGPISVSIERLGTLTNLVTGHNT